MLLEILETVLEPVIESSCKACKIGEVHNMTKRKRKNTYDIFEGSDLEIAQKIQQRRLQILIHSYLYYVKDVNIVSDACWSKWAMELVDLQRTYPEISSKVVYAKDFENFDGSSGAFFDYDKDIISRAEHLYRKVG